MTTIEAASDPIYLKLYRLYLAVCIFLAPVVLFLKVDR